MSSNTAGASGFRRSAPMRSLGGPDVLEAPYVPLSRIAADQRHMWINR